MPGPKKDVETEPEGEDDSLMDQNEGLDALFSLANQSKW